MDTFFQKATNPYQYDSLEIDWEKEGLEDSPIRKFFRNALDAQLEDLHGKRVVDIGSGLGHLFPFLRARGAAFVEGVEPSQKNAALSRKLYPDVSVFEGTLEQYSTEEKFDVGVAIMVFEHIYNLNSAFQKIAELLKSSGRLYFIAGNKEYLTTPRFNYQLDIRELENGVAICRTTREYGTLYDIVRPASHFTDAAEKAGFELQKYVGLKPTKELIEAVPRYGKFSSAPFNDFFQFTLM